MKIKKNSLIYRICCSYGMFWCEDWDNEPYTACTFIFWTLIGLLAICICVIIGTALIMFALECPLVFALQLLIGDGGWAFFGNLFDYPNTYNIFAGSCLIWFVAILIGAIIVIGNAIQDSFVTRFISDVWNTICLNMLILSCPVVEYIEEDDE